MFYRFKFCHWASHYLIWLSLILYPQSLSADTKIVYIAVASNFATTAQKLISHYPVASDVQFKLSTGSTGKLYSQILHGAPFDIFLSADQKHPFLLAQNKKAVPETQITYALGQLALTSSRTNTAITDGAILHNPDHFKKLAIANPQIAPYGAAAQKYLQQIGVWADIQAQIILGQNISQAFQFIQTGHADLGLIAHSLLTENFKGTYWPIPIDKISPIQQDAILLAKAENSAMARDFLNYLSTSVAHTLIQQDGYLLPASPQFQPESF